MTTKYIDAHYFFQAAGDIVPLNLWLDESIIPEVDALNADESTHHIRYEANENAGGDDDHYGQRGGYEYNHVPSNWGLPSNASTVSSLLYNKGDYLFPHRDKWRHLNEDGSFTNEFNGLRLVNFVNKTSQTDFCFVVDGKIVELEKGRWYAINTQRVHYGFSYADGIYHLGCDLSFAPKHRAQTTKFLLDNMAFPQPFDDRKGVDCMRN